MERKTQQLTFNLGITTMPSDAICPDNALEQELGMIYREGEHRVIQKPKMLVDDFELYGKAAKLMFIHKFSDEERQIFLQDDKIYSYDTNPERNPSLKELMTVSGETKVTAVGKILIVADENGLHYFMWKLWNEGYYTGVTIPELKVDCWMENATVDGKQAPQRFMSIANMKDNKARSLVLADDDGTLEYREDDEGGITFTTFVRSNDLEKDESLQNVAIGLASERINQIMEQNFFVNPFWLRFGVVLYDDTVTKLSNPILMMPSVRMPCYLLQSTAEHPEGQRNVNYFSAKVNACALRLTIDKDFADALKENRDLVKGVRVFASAGVQPFKMDAAWDFLNPPYNKTDDERLLRDEVCKRDWYNGESVVNEDGMAYKALHSAKNLATTYRYQELFNIQDDSLYFIYMLPTRKTDDEIMKELVSDSQFYKLFDLELDELLQNDQPYTIEAEKKMDDKTVSTLTTRDQLENDDYFSHASLYSKSILVYNNRLHLAGASRSHFEGFHQFMACKTFQEYELKIVVDIETATGRATVTHDATTRMMQGQFFYYPDPRARRARIYMKVNGNDWRELFDLTLKEHPGLHGAYSFKKLPSESDYTQEPFFGSFVDACYSDNGQNATLPTGTSSLELLPSVIEVSEVNNPMTFLASGEVSVNAGEIIGISTLTQALSQGQFGTFPLVVFTDSGMWALEVRSDGTYMPAKPMPREVCNNAASITQTDGAVFFTTDKGLMVVVGSEVKCVSEQLDGKVNGFMTKTKTEGNSEVIVPVPFADYAKDCFIAYDYRDSLLWLFKKGEAVCWVYSIKSGAFARYEFEQPIDNVVNNYPDYLLQSGNTIYSLLKRKNINKDDTAYEATIVTRPMKLENALALKTIVDMEHVCDLHKDVVAPVPGEDNQYTYDEGRIVLYVQVSNDLKNWQNLRSLRGTPWKYYRFTYELTNLLATDTFAGTVLLTEERRTDKLR